MKNYHLWLAGQAGGWWFGALVALVVIHNDLVNPNAYISPITVFIGFTSAIFGTVLWRRSIEFAGKP